MNNDNLKRPYAHYPQADLVSLEIELKEALQRPTNSLDTANALWNDLFKVSEELNIRNGEWTRRGGFGRPQ